jgi:putative flippase GtrA
MATTEPGRSRGARPSGVRGGYYALARHQLGALGATLVDFATMIACVHAGLTPVAGTALGAGVGAAANFALGRYWVFPAGLPGRARRQAIRYALVSLSSLALNTLGELLLHDVAHMQYVLARVVVAGAVSLAWNFPLQRGWVFA